MITSEGLGLILGVVFGAAAKPTAFYVGLIDATGYTGFSASDTMSSHSGWTELVSYDESSRPQINFGNPSGSTINNPTAVTFTPNAAGLVSVGYFITTNSTKNGTSGYLYAVGLFADGTKTMTSGIAEAFTMNVTDVSN